MAIDPNLTAGFGGDVKIVTDDITPIEDPVANIGEWSISDESEMMEAELMQQTAVRREYGLSSWEGEITVMFDKTDTKGQRAIINAKKNREKLQVRFYIDDTAYYEGVALVESIEHSQEANELVELEVSLQGDGELELMDGAAA